MLTQNCIVCINLYAIVTLSAFCSLPDKALGFSLVAYFTPAGCDTSPWPSQHCWVGRALTLWWLGTHIHPSSGCPGPSHSLGHLQGQGITAPGNARAPLPPGKGLPSDTQPRLQNPAQSFTRPGWRNSVFEGSLRSTEDGLQNRAAAVHTAGQSDTSCPVNESYQFWKRRKCCCENVQSDMADI